MAIDLVTLGGLRVSRDGVDLDRLPSQRLRAGLFVYLAVERCTARESVAAVFWPESTSANARHALRQSVYHLRGELGEEWLEARTHELWVGDAVRVDVHDFVATIDAGDAESAARMYRGPFLDGVNLVDLSGWEAWVESRRAFYARGFRKACRSWLEARRAAGDLAGAIEAAQHWVAPDPLDDEAQHRLIAALADAGERNEAIRHFDAYARLLESDGLQPLDETVALIARVRSDATALPALQPPHETDEAPHDTATPEIVPSEVQAPSPRAPDGPARRQPQRPLAWAVSLALVLVLGAAWAISGRRAEPPPSPSSSDIAVLPFSVRGGDDAPYLGAGMVTLLSNALDGVALRPVDPRAVFAVVAQDGEEVTGLDQGRLLAGRLGAGLFVLGDIVQVGSRFHIEAAVYRTADGAAPVTRVAVNGEEERVFEVIDDLAARLLAGIGGTTADRLASSAAATSSLTAFKAYLEGEADMRAGRFERAVDAYGRAVGIDSAFAIAYYRLALARDWAAIGLYGDAAGEAARHADRLSPRDRALLSALQAHFEGNAFEAERRYRAILARYPDDLDAWFQLGEILFHNAPRHGRSIAESEDAWRVVLSYEPRNVGALVHLARVAAVDGRLATLDSLLAPFEHAELTTDRRLVQMGLFRAIAAHDTTATDALVQEARGWEDAATYQLAAYLTSFSHDPGGARRVVLDLIEPHRGSAMIAELYWFAALLHLANGQIAAAERMLSDGIATPSPGRYRTFLPVKNWSMALLPLPWPDSTIERVRRTASSASTVWWNEERRGEPDGAIAEQIWLRYPRETFGESDRLEALRQYVVAVLSLRLGDAATAQSAADRLSRLATADAADGTLRDLDRDLRARLAWSAGQPEEALRILETLEYGQATSGPLNIVPFVARPDQRYLRGELLTALGRDAEALSWFASLGELSVPETPFRAPAHLRQAEIHERLGNEIEAAWHYSRVVELWRDSDAAFEPIVSRARARRSSLVQATGPAATGPPRAAVARMP